MATSVQNGISTKTAVVRRRVFKGCAIDGAGGIPAVLWQLHAERFTGKVTINMSQGGIQNAYAEDSHDLNHVNGA